MRMGYPISIWDNTMFHMSMSIPYEYIICMSVHVAIYILNHVEWRGVLSVVIVTLASD